MPNVFIPSPRVWLEITKADIFTTMTQCGYVFLHNARMEKSLKKKPDKARFTYVTAKMLGETCDFH